MSSLFSQSRSNRGCVFASSNEYRQCFFTLFGFNFHRGFTFKFYRILVYIYEVFCDLVYFFWIEFWLDFCYWRASVKFKFFWLFLHQKNCFVEVYSVDGLNLIFFCPLLGYVVRLIFSPCPVDGLELTYFGEASRFLASIALCLLCWA